MIDKDFRQLVNYVKNRPEAREAFIKALGLKSETMPKMWLSANKAGKLIGVSGKWMREHLALFPNTIRVKTGSTYCYKFDANEVTSQYDTFITNGSL